MAHSSSSIAIIGIFPSIAAFSGLTGLFYGIFPSIVAVNGLNWATLWDFSLYCGCQRAELGYFMGFFPLLRLSTG
ncbi:hypothetical protein [Paenibacillus sp. FSL R7-0331]|uniref:hypothetical protein n=1 Tax=Paenibacillus sp. FSL R7-0331 TaxID=1536773 RepID=UPI0012E0841A|nr:hypothetical protein [Paenibacillus sp. FSL R7-0331]